MNTSFSYCKCMQKSRFIVLITSAKVHFFRQKLCLLLSNRINLLLRKKFRANRRRLGKLKRVWFALGLHDWCSVKTQKFYDWYQPTISTHLGFPCRDKKRVHLARTLSSTKFAARVTAPAVACEQQTFVKLSANSCRTFSTCSLPPVATPSAKSSMTGNIVQAERRVKLA